MMVRIFVVLLAWWGVAGCDANSEPTHLLTAESTTRAGATGTLGATSRAPVSGTATSEVPVPTSAPSRIPFHRRSPVAEHAAPKAPPPPAAERLREARRVMGEDHVAIVSDVELVVGGSRHWIIEVQPSGIWKLNTEYPVSLTLSGLSASSTPTLDIRSDALPVERFRATSGGMRIDIPLSGERVGKDTVRAQLSFGVCTQRTCELRKIAVTASVDVATS